MSRTRDNGARLVGAGSNGESSPLFVSEDKIYPKSVDGRFARWRWALVFVTQAVFYGLPWLSWNGRQAVLFDLGERKFHFFGLILYPQDFIYLTLLLIISALSLFLFTALAGRLWCGYACPQTVYTEVFLWIERQVEGDRNQRMKRDAGPSSPTRFRLKVIKHSLWIALSFWTGLSFVGYFVPVRELVPSLLTFSVSAWTVFWVLFYGFATYGNAGFLREQVCKYMCPYARFQGVMCDRDTLVITYDAERGEPRGSRSRQSDYRSLGLGSCIDCNLCVQVCPTGIDIRDGQQFECIGCAACIDACDAVMEKVGYPTGLVRYDTLNGLENGFGRGDQLRRVARPRVLVYTGIVMLLVTLFVTSLVARVPLKVDVIRDRAVLSRDVGGGVFENVYRFLIINGSEREQVYLIAAEGLDGLRIDTNEYVRVGPASNRLVAVRVRAPRGDASAGAHSVVFTITSQSDSALAVRESAAFIFASGL